MINSSKSLTKYTQNFRQKKYDRIIKNNCSNSYVFCTTRIINKNLKNFPGAISKRRVLCGKLARKCKCKGFCSGISKQYRDIFDTEEFRPL